MQAEQMSRTSRGMAAVGTLAATVGLAVATLPAGAQAEVVTPHTVAPQVVTPHPVAPPPSTPAPAPSSAPAESSAPAPVVSQPDAAPVSQGSASGSRGSRRERGVGGDHGQDLDTSVDPDPLELVKKVWMGGLSGWPGEEQFTHWGWVITHEGGFDWGILVEWPDPTRPPDWGYGPDGPTASDGEKWTSIGNKLDAASIDLMASFNNALKADRRPVAIPTSPATTPGDPTRSAGTGDPESGSGTSQGGSPVAETGSDNPTDSNDPFGIQGFIDDFFGGNQGGSGIGPDVKKLAEN